MHPVILNKFGAICATHLPAAARVLEIGAMPEEQTLLNLPALHATALRVGINLNIARPYEGLCLVQVAADGLAAFAAGSFDAVLCNSVLEHDARFWETLAGMRRVARPGALMVVGVPGFAEQPPPPWLRGVQRAARLPWLSRQMERLAPGWESATATLAVHNYPGDYYRFSVQAMHEVIMSGCRDVEVQVVMQPPRIIGFGWRAQG